MPEFIIDIDPMSTISISVEVRCSCGESLCKQSSVKPRGRGVVVEPCQKCLDAAKTEGHIEGYEKGCEEWFTKGHIEGYSEGYDEGLGKEDC